MVALGLRDGQEIPVDIAALGGLGLTGPGAAAAARAILAGLLAQALPGQPAGPAEVIMTAADAAVLFPGPDGLTGGSIPGLVITPTLDAALDHAEALLLRRARHTGLPDPGDSTGEDGAAPALPAAVLIATPPRASQRLAACSNRAAASRSRGSCWVNGHRAAPAMSPPTGSSLLLIPRWTASRCSTSPPRTAPPCST